jgi:cell shape-determining protein MreD
MQKVSLSIPLLLALCAQLCSSIFFPSFRLIAFAPFLAIAFQRLSLLRSLWTAALVGLLVDLMSPSFRFGLFSLAYSLTAWIAYRQKSLFFEDKPLALFFYTTFISCLASAVQLSLLLLSSSRLPIDFASLVTDLVGMPLVDGLYAFFWFTCPLQVYTHARKKWKRF